MGQMKLEMEKIKRKEITITETRKKLKQRKNCKRVQMSMKSV